MIRRSFLAAVLLLILASNSHAQNVWTDYVVNQPHYYSPADPWKTGVVFRTQMGHGGFFYNCDHQEDKRYSPYLYWSRQPQKCKTKHPISSYIANQICEVRQRICWGRSCGTYPSVGATQISPSQPATDVAPSEPSSATPDVLPAPQDSYYGTSAEPKQTAGQQNQANQQSATSSGDKESANVKRKRRIASRNSDGKFRMIRVAPKGDSTIRR